MAILLFRLNGVPDDEAADIRALLEQRHIDYYETDAGRWGISVAAIWLRDEDRLIEARRLIDAYEEERAATARAAYEELRRENRHDTLPDHHAVRAPALTPPRRRKKRVPGHIPPSPATT